MTLGVIAIGVSGVTFTLSRAGKIRAYENRLHEQLLNAATRIESLESRWTEQIAHLELVEDEIRRNMEGTRKERQKLTTETRRAEQVAALAANGGGDGPRDISGLERGEQLRQVAGWLRGA